MKLGLFRRLYSLIPGRIYLMEPFRRLGILPSAWTKHWFVHGTMRIKTASGQGFRMMNRGHYIETLLYWNGLEQGWERVSTGVWGALSREASTVLDVGANTGIYSLIAWSSNPKSHVHAFEPVPGVFDLLELNNRLNGQPLNVHPIACGNIDGEATLYEGLDNHYEASLVQDTHGKGQKQRAYTVPVRTLDGFLLEAGLDRVDLIKIDVEKFEPQVLAGFQNFKVWKPSLLIEILDDSIAAYVEEFVKDLGYLFFNVNEERGLIPTSKLSRSSTYNFLLVQAPQVALLQPWIVRDSSEGFGG